MADTAQCLGKRDTPLWPGVQLALYEARRPSPLRARPPDRRRKELHRPRSRRRTVLRLATPAQASPEPGHVRDQDPGVPCF
jgi:hypothetical protein